MYLYGAGEGHSILDVGLSSVSGASSCMQICTVMVFSSDKKCITIYDDLFENLCKPILTL